MARLWTPNEKLTLQTVSHHAKKTWFHSVDIQGSFQPCQIAVNFAWNLGVSLAPGADVGAFYFNSIQLDGQWQYSKTSYMEYWSVCSKSISYARFILYARFHFWSNISNKCWFYAVIFLQYQWFGRFWPKKKLIFDLICHKFNKISKSVEIIVFSYEHHSKINKNTRKIVKKCENFDKKGIEIFHMRGDLWSNNFGLQQKYSICEVYYICEYSICGVLLY